MFPTPRRVLRCRFLPQRFQGAPCRFLDASKISKCRFPTPQRFQGAGSYHLKCVRTISTGFQETSQYCPVQCFSVQCCSYSFLTLLCGTSNKRILLKNSFNVLHYIVDHSFYSYTFDAFFDYLNSLIPPPYVDEESCVRVCQLFCRELCE